MGEPSFRGRTVLSAIVLSLAAAAVAAHAQPALLEPHDVVWPVLSRSLYLSGEMGPVEGVAGHKAVKYLLPDVPAGADYLAQVEKLGAADAEAVAPRWFTPGVWRDDMVIVGDTTAKVHVVASAHAGAQVVVTLEEIRPDGIDVPLVEGAAPLPLGGAGAVDIEVPLATDGLIVQAGHALRLTIGFHDAHVATVLRYGSTDAASGVPGLALQVRDRDGDGLGDTAELRLLSDPYRADGDGDGFSDTVEVFAGSDPLDAGSVPPKKRLDADGDGIADAAEARFGTDPYRADTDGDGFGDGLEARLGHDPLDAGDRPTDLDGDGLPDVAEPALGLDPANPDSDGDGILDGDEDPDGDGLSNRDEIAYGTDPLGADTDGDGRRDGREVAAGSQPGVVDAATESDPWLLPAGLAAVGAAGTGAALPLVRRLRR